VPHVVVVMQGRKSGEIFVAAPTDLPTTLQLFEVEVVGVFVMNCGVKERGLAKRAIVFRLLRVLLPAVLL
jgi:hypothetical protein